MNKCKPFDRAGMNRRHVDRSSRQLAGSGRVATRAALLILAFGFSGSALSDSGSWRSEADYKGYGIEAFFDYLEDAPAPPASRAETKSRALGGSKGKSEVAEEEVVASVAADMASSGIRAAVDANCAYVWVDASHRYRYSRYVRKFYIKTRMWVDTSAYLGSKTNPNACDRRPYKAARIFHEGGVYSNPVRGFDDGIPNLLVKVSPVSKPNRTELKSYRSMSKRGNSARKPECSISEHTVQIGSKFVKRVRRTGNCVEEDVNIFF